MADKFKVGDVCVVIYDYDDPRLIGMEVTITSNRYLDIDKKRILIVYILKSVFIRLKLIVIKR